jgi:hypothetical protein
MTHDRQARARARSHGSDGSGANRILFRAHWLVPLVLQLPLLAALILTGHGWFAPATLLIPFAAARVPYRCTVSGTTIIIRWAFFTDAIPFDSLEAALLGPDPRRWVLGRRGPVLILTRRGARRILIFGELYRLEMLRATLERAGIGGDARGRSA